MFSLAKKPRERCARSSTRSVTAMRATGRGCVPPAVAAIVAKITLPVTAVVVLTSQAVNYLGLGRESRSNLISRMENSNGKTD